MPEGALKSKAMIQRALVKMFKGEQLMCTEEEEAGLMLLLGSHSIQKFVAAYARRGGVTNDENV
jgi:hypothetical protein